MTPPTPWCNWPTNKRLHRHIQASKPLSINLNLGGETSAFWDINVVNTPFAKAPWPGHRLCKHVSPPKFLQKDPGGDSYGGIRKALEWRGMALIANAMKAPDAEGSIFCVNSSHKMSQVDLGTRAHFQCHHLKSHRLLRIARKKNSETPMFQENTHGDLDFSSIDFNRFVHTLDPLEGYDTSHPASKYWSASAASP